MHQDGPTRRELLTGGAVLAAATMLAACGNNATDSALTPAASSAAAPGPSTAATPTSIGTFPSTAPRPATRSASDYVPPPTGEWEAADATATGWSPPGLDRVVQLVGSSNSRTFLMLSGGRILAEHYFGGTTADTLQDIASVQKSVTSTLVGIAVEKGAIALSDPVSKYLPEPWSNARPDEEGSITVKHLLTMTSGLNPDTLKKDVDPGTKWVYNTAAYQRLRPVLEAATKQDINSLSRAWMFDTIGISSAAKWAPRPAIAKSATDATGEAEWGLSLTARDMGRFGLLSQRRGQWYTTSVVRAEWYDEAWAPTETKRDYGYLWWLMGKGGLGEKGAPKDLVAGLGAQDQKIYVVPSLDLVIARQGLAAKEVSETSSDFDALLLKAISAARS